MLIRKGQEAEGLEVMSRSIASLLTYFAMAGYAVLGEAIEVVQDSVKTAATDGRNIYYNPVFWLFLTVEQRVFVLLHEFLHIFLGHYGRRQGRDPKKWNIACDIFVNCEASQITGIPIPRWAIHPPHWYIHGKFTVEQIFDRLEDNEGAPKEKLPEEFGTGELADGTDILDPQETEQEKAEWVEKFRSDMAQADLVNEQAGHKHLVSPGLRSRLDKISKGEIPFDRLFRGAVQEGLGFDEVTWTHPDPSAAWAFSAGLTPAFILPEFQALKERLLLVLVDVSTSVQQQRLNQFASNIENAAQHATKTVIATFDKQVRERYETDRPGEILRNIQLLVGSHHYTDSRPAFAIAEEVDPTVIACFTDGHIYLPDPYPQTLFVRPPEPEGRPLPWGREFVLETLF